MVWVLPSSIASITSVIAIVCKGRSSREKRRSLTKVDIETAIVFPRVTDIPDNAAEIL